jgi:hypothetical protein
VSPGYGVGYAAADDALVFNVASWKTNGPKYSSEEFFRAVYASGVDMQKLIAKMQPELLKGGSGKPKH